MAQHSYPYQHLIFELLMMVNVSRQIAFSISSSNSILSALFYVRPYFFFSTKVYLALKI